MCTVSALPCTAIPHRQHLSGPPRRSPCPAAHQRLQRIPPLVVGHVCHGDHRHGVVQVLQRPLEVALLADRRGGRAGGLGGRCEGGKHSLRCMQAHAWHAKLVNACPARCGPHLRATPAAASSVSRLPVTGQNIQRLRMTSPLDRAAPSAMLPPRRCPGCYRCACL